MKGKLCNNDIMVIWMNKECMSMCAWATSLQGRRDALRWRRLVMSSYVWLKRRFEYLDHAPFSLTVCLDPRASFSEVDAKFSEFARTAACCCRIRSAQQIKAMYPQRAVQAELHHSAEFIGPALPTRYVAPTFYWSYSRDLHVSKCETSLLNIRFLGLQKKQTIRFHAVPGQ